MANRPTGGRGSKLYRFTGTGPGPYTISDWTLVEGIKSIGNLSFSRETEDVSTLDEPGIFKDFIALNAEWDDVDFTFVDRDQASYQYLVDNARSVVPVVDSYMVIDTQFSPQRGTKFLAYPIGADLGERDGDAAIMGVMTMKVIRDIDQDRPPTFTPLTV